MSLGLGRAARARRQKKVRAVMLATMQNNECDMAGEGTPFPNLPPRTSHRRWLLQRTNVRAVAGHYPGWQNWQALPCFCFCSCFCFALLRVSLGCPSSSFFFLPQPRSTSPLQTRRQPRKNIMIHGPDWTLASSLSLSLSCRIVP